MHQATLFFELTLQLHVFLASWWESRLQMRLQDDCGIFGSLMPTLVKSAGSTFPLEVYKVQLPKKNKYKDQSSFKPIISYDCHNFKKSVLFHLGVFFLEQETCIPLIQIALEFFASIFFCLQLHLRIWTLLPLLLSTHIWQYLTCMRKLKTLTYTHHLYMHLDPFLCHHLKSSHCPHLKCVLYSSILIVIRWSTLWGQLSQHYPASLWSRSALRQSRSAHRFFNCSASAWSSSFVPLKVSRKKWQKGWVVFWGELMLQQDAHCCLTVLFFCHVQLYNLKEKCIQLLCSTLCQECGQVASNHFEFMNHVKYSIWVW